MIERGRYRGIFWAFLGNDENTIYEKRERTLNT